MTDQKQKHSIPYIFYMSGASLCTRNFITLQCVVITSMIVAIKNIPPERDVFVLKFLDYLRPVGMPPLLERPKVLAIIPTRPQTETITKRPIKP